MKHSNGWQLKLTSVGALSLDPKNPRIAPDETTLTERELIEELVTHENVLELTKKIAANGFFPSEPLIVVIEEGKKRVVEGNRRLAACKLLVNPALAPKALEKKFRAIAGSPVVASLRRIPAIYAPSREATYPLIIARHTDTQIEKWQPAMQSHFYSNLLESGLSVEDVAERFNVNANKVRDSLHDHNLYRMACQLDLPEAEEEIVRDPRQFKLSTLKRIFETPIGREFFGVELSSDGKIRGKLPAEAFAPGFSRLVSDIATGKKDSRTLNTPTQIKRYLDEFDQSEKPDLGRLGSFDSDSFGTSETPTAVPPPKAGTPRKRIPRVAPIGLIPSPFPRGSGNARVRLLVKELQKLSPKHFVNACAFTFRSLIELGVFCFLEAKGEIVEMQKDYANDIVRRNAKRPPDKQVTAEPNWTPNLSAMMSRISDPSRGLLNNVHARKALSKVIKEEEELFGLNLSTHNPTYHPSEARLRSTWQNLEEFFREILS